MFDVYQNYCKLCVFWQVEQQIHPFIFEIDHGRHSFLQINSAVLHIKCNLTRSFQADAGTDQDHCPYIDNEDLISKIIRVKEIIIDSMNNPPGLDELAKTVGLNIKKLKTAFKDYYGLPVFSFLLNYKMELAKRMLEENKLNVNELATYLGYSTSSHFITAFKRKYGITPKQFAKSMQQ